jgi:hypothetical protein
MEDLERQLAELEALASIYPDECEVDEASLRCVEGAVAGADAAIPPGLQMLQCTIKLDNLLTKVTASGGEQWCHPVISIAFPHDYPQSAAPVVTFFGDSDAVDGFAADVAHKKIIKTCFDENSGEECTMQLVMFLNEHITAENERMREERRTIQKQKEETKTIFDACEQEAIETSLPLLGRRLIYSHHIINPGKRKVIKEWASELELGGYTKIGWPGIIIVEGSEDGCQEYVRRLQHLRWQYLSVRGEQQEEGTAGGSLDELRAMPKKMVMLGEDKMSELAQLCRDAGLEELFLTALKIYGRGGGGGGSSEKEEGADTA